MIRRILFAIPVLGLFVVALLALSFFLVPTDRLNGLIAKQLTESFGHEVVVSGRPSVSLLPYLSVSFGPVKVESGNKDMPLMQVARANGRLSVTSLWEGKPALRFIVLDRANVTLVRDDNGRSNWAATNFFSKGDDGPTNAPELRFPSRLRTITLQNSTLTVQDPSLEAEEVLTSFNAVISGPPRFSEFSVEGSFIWRGELVDGKATLAKPGVFMTGGPSEAEVSLNAGPVEASFKGSLSWDAILRGEGTLEADISAPNQMASWLGFDKSEVLPALSMRVLGDGVFTREKFTFRPIAVRLDEGKADGRLDIDLSQNAIGLSGTLAFDRLAVAADANIGVGDGGFFERMMSAGAAGAVLDLRLSAETLQLGEQQIDNAAFGVVLSEKSFVLNIGSADVVDPQEADGVAMRFSGEMSMTQVDDIRGLAGNFSLRDGNMVAIERLFGRRLPISGAVNASVRAVASGKTGAALEDSLAMTIKADLKDGTLKRVRFDGAVANSESVEDKDLNGDSYLTNFEVGTFEGRVNANGTIDVSALELSNPALDASLGGLVILADDKVSLSGTISPKAGEATGVPNKIEVSMGGLLSAPRISSVNGRQLEPSNRTQ